LASCCFRVLMHIVSQLLGAFIYNAGRFYVRLDRT